MKKFIPLLFLFVATTQWLSAQTSNEAQSEKSMPPTATQQVDDAAARAATDLLVAKYTLNADQAKQMYTIQVRKLRNLKEIEGLQSTNPTYWNAKRQNVQNGTLSSIRRILRTKEQVALYNKTQSTVRVQRGEKRKEMMLKNASKEAIEIAVTDVYAE